MELNPADYRYIPGVSQVTDVDDVATLGLHDDLVRLITEESLAREIRVVLGGSMLRGRPA